MKRLLLFIIIITVAASCKNGQEKSAAQLARRIVPEYASRIDFRHTPDTTESYSIAAKGRRLVISGSGANAMAAGLGRYLRDICGVDVSWSRRHTVELPDAMPLPDSAIRSRALVPQRFFLNYCTFGYTMPWWKWEDWERFIDWMALQGINLPLAISGQEAIWQEVWRMHGMTDEQIRAWFTGPAHLPWHRMCNIDGVDGPLPQGWIDGQKALQKKIVARERKLGMTPVLPAFGGHVPAEIKERYPNAAISQIRGWCGFPPENRPYFLSAADSLYGVIQRQFLTVQEREYGKCDIYGFDLFNEVAPPSWDPQTLAAISKGAYESIAWFNPDARWLQMGWMFYNDSRHWTPEIIEAYLEAVPQGKVTILDYYTENVPVWTLTDSFYGQPFIFCYLGNFGGNTRLAGPFRKESARITEALGKGCASGIGCTLEGFGVNRWFYEYVMDSAWSGSLPDDEWLASLDRRRHSPEGFWKAMADSIYLRGSFSEDPLLCGRPCMEGYHDWRVIHKTPYGNDVLVQAWNVLLDEPSVSGTWRYDAVNLGCQALGNHFATLRDELAAAYRKGNLQAAEDVAARMRELMDDIAKLCACEPEFRLEDWLDDASGWAAVPEEKDYYKHNAWHLLTTWGDTPYLNDYASRMWSGLVATYYSVRWNIFLEEVMDCMRENRAYDQNALEARLDEYEKRMQEQPVNAADATAAEDLPGYCNYLYDKWFKKKLTVMSWNVGVFSKYSEDSEAEVARMIDASGADLVALNELDSCNRRHNVFQLKELAQTLGGWEYHFASAFPFAGGAYGNGVVSRVPVMGRHGIDLPLFDGAEPRSCAVVETDCCVFASVHLDYKGDTASVAQAHLLNEWFSERYAGCRKPVILCGDFNSRPGSEAIRVLSERWQLLSGTDPTYPSDAPDRCIDYIFALKAAAPVRTLAAEVVTAAGDASDHLPVLVTLK